MRLITIMSRLFPPHGGLLSGIKRPLPTWASRTDLSLINSTQVRHGTSWVEWLKQYPISSEQARIVYEEVNKSRILGPRVYRPIIDGQLSPSIKTTNRSVREALLRTPGLQEKDWAGRGIPFDLAVEFTRRMHQKAMWTNEKKAQGTFRYWALWVAELEKQRAASKADPEAAKAEPEAAKDQPSPPSGLPPAAENGRGKTRDQGPPAATEAADSDRRKTSKSPREKTGANHVGADTARQAEQVTGSPTVLRFIRSTLSGAAKGLKRKLDGEGHASTETPSTPAAQGPKTWWEKMEKRRAKIQIKKWKMKDVEEYRDKNPSLVSALSEAAEGLKRKLGGEGHAPTETPNTPALQGEKPWWEKMSKRKMKNLIVKDPVLNHNLVATRKERVLREMEGQKLYEQMLRDKQEALHGSKKLEKRIANREGEAPD